MTIHCIRIAPVPLDESCAQHGRTTDFDKIATIESAIHHAALVARFGTTPDGVTIEIEAASSPSGRSYHLAVRFDDEDPAAKAYVQRLADEPLSRWHEAGFTPPFLYAKSGAVQRRVHPTLTSAVRAAIATLGQFPANADLAAMRNNLLAAYPQDRTQAAANPPLQDLVAEPFTRSAHLALLARARAAIDAPGLLDDDARNALIADIDTATTRFSTWSLPWPIDVYVGSIDHRAGVNHYAAVTRQALMHEMAEYCREFWSEVRDDRDPFTLDDETVVSDYFQQHPDEFHCTNIEHLLPKPAIDPGFLAEGKVLFLNSRHIDPSSEQHLNEWTGPAAMEAPLFVTDTTMGWFMPTDPDRCFEGIPDEIEGLLNFARSQGADHLLIGCDGVTVYNLPLHDH